MPDLLPSVSADLKTGNHEVAALVQTPLSMKYAALASVATPQGATVQSYLGAALGSVMSLPQGGEMQRYERGVIIARKAGGVFAVYGDIYAQWYRLGGVPGLLALPLSDQTAAGAGAVQTFDGGDIAWSVATGARSIHGAIRDRWHALGGATGVLGFPISDENPLIANGAEVGRFNAFPNGAGIYWSAATGAWDVYGEIAACWQRYRGGIGPLGLPIGGETDTPDSGGRYNEFSGGIIVWHPSGPYAGANALFDLECYVDHFESDFSPIHVQVNVDFHHPDASNHTWFPSDSDYKSNPVVQQTLASVAVVNAGTTLDIWMDGLGDHTLGEDERLGVFQMHYDITNLWGIFENATHPVNQNVDAGHHLNCIFTCRTQPPFDPSVPFRAQEFWPFHNPDIGTMSDSMFAQTFADVSEGEEALWHPFDRLFYELVYKEIGEKGTCFGMCLEALYAKAGRSVFTEPIYNNPENGYSTSLAQGGTPDLVTVPSDARFMDPIGIKHGYQLGDRVVFYFLELFALGKTHDPVAAFDGSHAAFDAGDFPVICLTDSSFGSGHVVLPYAWDKTGAPWKIFVANPNAPYSVQPDDAAPTNCILVDPVANSFSLAIGYDDNGAPETWTGNASGGGRMYFIPFSVMNSEPNTPYADILTLIESAAIVILGGDGHTTQVTDQHGRTLDGSTPLGRIPNMSSIPLHSGETSLLQPAATATLETAVNDSAYLQRLIPAAGASREAYALRRPPLFTPAAAPADPLEHEIIRPGFPPVSPELEIAGEDATLTWTVASTGSASYVWGLRSPSGSVVATVLGAAGAADTIVIQDAVRALPAFTLKPAAGISKTASITLVGPTIEAGPSARIFDVSDVPMNAAAPVTLQLQDGGDSLQIVNAGSDVTLTVRMQAGSATGNAMTRTVVAAAGNTTVIAPASWSSPTLSSATATLRRYDRPGGTLLEQKQI